MIFVSDKRGGLPYLAGNLWGMKKNLETADTFVKLLLSLSVIVLFLLDVISGPASTVLMALGSLLVVIFIARALLHLFSRD
jgi:hypothetical protein